MLSSLQQYLPFTVLKRKPLSSATISVFSLQQYLPFTVLKPDNTTPPTAVTPLQQYLPFTVLKRSPNSTNQCRLSRLVATVLTVYGIETWRSFLRNHVVP